jgi:two-component system OmpR family response regulator
VRDLLDDALRLAGYDTVLAADGREGLNLWRSGHVDLCIVDVNMPRVDGFAFVQALREKDTRTPVLLLSARNAASDVAQGLRCGADDYVRKPFGLEELLLRVAGLLRRSGVDQPAPGRLTCGPLSLDIDRHEVQYLDEPIDLSATEFRLLEVLMERKDRLVTREQLLDLVWDIDFHTESSVVETYVSYLRKKLHRDGFAPLTTVRGVGFKLVEPLTA